MTQEPPQSAPAPGSREALRRERGAGFRRAVGLTALGTILPGAGLTQTRSKRLGWALFGLFLAGVAVTAWYVLTKGTVSAALSLVSRPNLVETLGIGFAVVGLIWCASIVLTAVRSRPAHLDRSRTRILGVFTAVMVLAVAGLSYKVAEYATITKDTVQQVFGPDTPAKRGQGAKVVEGADPWRDTPRVNVLLLGSDAGVDRTGTRTDSMIVASIDTKTGRTVLISLPRNLQQVPLPADSKLRALWPGGVYGEPQCPRAQKDPNDPCMLNAIWTETDEFAANHPGAFPGDTTPGRTETRDVIGEILGLKIDHTVVIDLAGFKQLVDAMGGVTINVKLSAYGTKLPIGGHSDGRGGIVGAVGYFEPGRQHLSGNLALWYARTRAADDDFSRQSRQRCVVKALVEQVNPASMLTKYAEVAQIARENIYTDIPASSLSAFVDLIQKIQKTKLASVALSPANGINPGRPNYTLVHKLVNEAIKPPAPTAPATHPTTTTSTPSSSTTSSAPVDECA